MIFFVLPSHYYIYCTDNRSIGPFSFVALEVQHKPSGPYSTVAQGSISQYCYNFKYSRNVGHTDYHYPASSKQRLLFFVLIRRCNASCSLSSCRGNRGQVQRASIAPFGVVGILLRIPVAVGCRSFFKLLMMVSNRRRSSCSACDGC
jgi:hypothetical protein